MGFQLSQGQQEAVDKIKKWYKDGNKQVFTVAGYAGSGKSTIVKIVIEELSREYKKFSEKEMTGTEDVASLPWTDKGFNARYVAFTGKAALVLTMKGNPATTIHKLIYDAVKVHEPIIGPDGQPIKNLDGTPKLRKKTKFIKRPFIDPTIDLLVVDEVSMVSKKLMDDLLSYGKPIICLGDPGQLPPIGDDNGYLNDPDVFLTEIHRQAADNPIIYLSMLAREGKRIPYGFYGNQAAVIRKDEISERSLLKADQILCGKNVTRKQLNAHMRNLLGFKGDLPQKGDKLICTQNNWDEVIESIPLINGLIGYCHSDLDPDSIDNDQRTFRLDFRPEFMDDYFEGLLVDMEGFVEYDEPLSKGKRTYERVNQFDFGYAITVHKSQGSSFPKVLVYDEWLGDRDFHAKWLYTAITRASEKLIIAM